MTTEVSRLVVTLDARLAAYEANMRRGTAMTNQSLNAMEARFSAFSQKMERQAAALGGNIGGIFGTIGTYLTAQQLTDYANMWNRVTRAVSGSSEVFGMALKTGEELNALASDARVDLESYTKLYIRTSAAIRDYNMASGTAEKVTSTLSKALKLGGATAGEQASTLLQFSQALQKGKLDGDEFRTVMENAGVVQQLLAERLGVSRGALIDMAAQGKLKIQDLVGAMVDGSDKIDAAFRRQITTVDEAFMVLNNAITQYIGDLDKTYGASKNVAGAIALMARNIETVGDVTLVLGSILLTTFSARMIAQVWAFAAASAAALGPIGLIAVSAAAASAAFVAFGDDIRPIPGQMANLQEAMGGVSDEIAERLKPLMEQLGDVAAATGDSMLDAFKGLLDDGVLDKLGKKFVQLHELAYKVAVPSEQLRNLINSGVEGAGSYIGGVGAGIAAKAEARRQANIGSGSETTLIKPPPPLPGGAGTDPNAKLSAYQKEVNEIIKRTKALEVQAQMVGKNTFETEKAAAARELLTAAEETARRTGTAVTAAQVADIQQMAEAYAQVQAKVEYLNALYGAEENIRALREELDLVGLQGKALDEARVRQQLLNAARKAGVEANVEQINALARETAALQEFKRAIDETRDVSRDMLKGIVDGALEGQSALELTAGALDKLAKKLTDMAVDGLVEAALGGLVGGSGTKAGGGGILGSIFGFANGGIASGGRPMALPMFAKGGISNSAAIFGEAGPEAAVPLPDGRRIPVDLRMPEMKQGGGAVNVTVAPVFHVENGTPEGVAKLQTEMVPTIEKVVRQMVPDMIQRTPKLRR